MARGPVANMTVTGDARDAIRAFDDVEKHAEEMGDTVKREGGRVGDGLNTMTDGADGAERRFRGMSDTIGGTGQTMAAFKDGDIVGVIGGLTDLAGGIADFVGPALSKMAEKLGIVTVATETQTGAQVASNTAMSANPIGLVVLALVALGVAFYVLWNKSETFREIVTGAFEAVKAVAVGTFEWIKENWPLLLAILTGPFGLAVLAIVRHRDDIVGFFDKVADKLKAALQTVEHVVTAPFKAARDVITAIASGVGEAFDAIPGAIKGVINTLIRTVNRIQIHIHFDTHIPGVGAIGFDWNGPGIPELALGGIVRARPGGTLVRAAERGEDEVIAPLSRLRGVLGGGDTIIHMPIGVRPEDAFLALERYRRRNGLAS